MMMSDAFRIIERLFKQKNLFFPFFQQQQQRTTAKVFSITTHMSQIKAAKMPLRTYQIYSDPVYQST